MKNAIIFHGMGGTPDLFWFPYIKSQLESTGYQVWVPQLPSADTPDIRIWLPFALKNGTYKQDTVLIGHSSGCPLILSILENLHTPIRLAILVAGFAQSLTPTHDPILQPTYNWDKIKRNVHNIIFINSDNDPWGCDDKAGRFMFDHLGGTLIIRHGEGHMGSTKFNQPYKEFPLLVSLVKGS